MNLPNLPMEIENYVEEARLIQAGSRRAKLDSSLRTRICEVWRPKSASATNTGVRLETSSGRTADASDEQCLIAASGVALLQALKKYKEKLFEYAKTAGLNETEIGDEFEEKRSEKKLPRKWSETKEKIKNSKSLSNEEKENLLGFAIKPNEFGGHKGIARDDFFTPAICRQDVSLSVTHNKIVSDLCEKLCETPELLNDLKAKIEEISQDDEWALSTSVFNKKLKDKNVNVLAAEFRKELTLATNRNETWWYMKMGNFSFSVLNQGKLAGTASSQRKCKAWQEKYNRDPQGVLALAAGALNSTQYAKNVSSELGIPFSVSTSSSCSGLGGQFESELKNAGFFSENDLPKRLVNSLIAKPFVILTGNSGTGKTRIGELLAQWFWGSDKKGYEIVAVGADWTDNRNIVGFLNHLIKDDRGLPLYSSTKILDLMARANSDHTRPYFLILDEMNLSHVERYFADFLSAMESLDRCIKLHDEGLEGEYLKSAQHSDPWIPKKIKIPTNLFIIGTVNVDETTYMFSPKVLDRANVIEFRTSTDSLADYLGSGATKPTKIKGADQSALTEFVNKSNSSQVGELSTLLENSDWLVIEKSLRDIYEILKTEKQEFGFRTANEICRYLNVVISEAEGAGRWNWENALDAQIVQKILPKLHGSRRKLESLLISLSCYLHSGKNAPVDENTLDEVIQGTGGLFKMSFGKTKEMLLSLRRSQFVSFIE